MSICTEKPCHRRQGSLLRWTFLIKNETLPCSPACLCPCCTVSLTQYSDPERLSSAKQLCTCLELLAAFSDTSCLPSEQGLPPQSPYFCVSETTQVVSAEDTALEVGSRSNLHFILNSVGRLLFSGVSISATRYNTLKLVLIFNNRNTLHLNGAFQSAFQILNNLRLVFFHFYGMPSLEDLAAVLR